MAAQQRAKQERVIEAVRHGLEGEATVDFVRQSGFAITRAGIARHLSALGGIVKVQEAIAAGQSNLDILQAAYPETSLDELKSQTPDQGELFINSSAPQNPTPYTPIQRQAFETRKLTLTIPSDLHETLKLAAKGEGKTRNDLITEILTQALAHMPRQSNPEELEIEDP